MDAGIRFIATGAVLAFGVVLLAWCIAMPWMLSVEKRRKWQKVQSTAIGPFDEVFHPAAYRANITVEIQNELPAPAPVPGDKPFRDGQIVISH